MEEISWKPVKKRKNYPLLINLVIRLVKEKPLGTVGGIIVLVIFFTGIFANFLSPYDYNDCHPADAMMAPSVHHLLGTDGLGRDLFSRIIYGARVSMVVGLAGASLCAVIATLIGGISGFIGGKLDLLFQRIVDAFMCFPALFFLLALMAVVGQGLPQVIIVLGIQSGISQSRIIRSAVIGIKGNAYFETAVSIGASPARIFFCHVLPNIMAPIIIIFSISMSHMILSEATLSFLGFGIPPPLPSWGGMLSGEGRTYMLVAPWIAIWPGLALGISVYSINILGDAIRDILDPRLRGGLGRYVKTKNKKATS